MLYDLHLAMRYRFARPSGGGRQHLRITPAHLPGRQDLRETAIRVTPTPLEMRRFSDFFGTEVHELVMPAGMSEMQIEMLAQVHRRAVGPGLDVSPLLADMPELLAQITVLSGDSPWHYLAASPRIPAVPAIAHFAADAVAGSHSVHAAVEALGRALHQWMTFDAAATEVDTPIAEAFAGRRGVCQDFAQIMICGLRAIGIPAGYAAGYLRTLAPPGRPKLRGADAMHAWCRAWAGPQVGWLEYDATNLCWVNGDHILVGQGRDYGDVAPITGSLRLDGEQSGVHSVDIAERAAPR